MKRIVVLGSTGSIGSNACEIIASHPGNFAAAALAVRKNARRGLEQAKALHAAHLAVEDEAAAREVAEECRCSGIELHVGADAASEVAALAEADIVLVSLVGMSGLKPALAAIDAGHRVALATKEVLVAAGEFVTARARARGVKLVPVDSEHSAIFQALQSLGNDSVEQTSNRTLDRLILTASGGPFLDAPADLSKVTPAQALDHPRWKMGPKVTIDSSTMMNKGFEILEARWLFDVPVPRIDVVVHPESIVHSLVTFVDGSTLAQLAPPDMRVPIQYAFTWPDRLPSSRARLDLAALGALHFRVPDPVRFPCLRIVREANAAGGTATAVLSAADEVAVARFVRGEIPYTGIPELLERALEKRPDIACDSLDAVCAADAWARDFAASEKV